MTAPCTMKPCKRPGQRSPPPPARTRSCGLPQSAGNFQMMNRLVDATGVPIGASQRAIAADLGLDQLGAP